MKAPALLIFATLALGLTAMAKDAPPTEVVKFDHSKIEESFARKLPFPMLDNSKFRVTASIRLVPGAEAEFHDFDTDIFYVIEGSATLVTGGTATELKQISPGERR